MALHDMVVAADNKDECVTAPRPLQAGVVDVVDVQDVQSAVR